MTKNLTPWFPVSTPPIRWGEYEVWFSGERQTSGVFRLWDGERWKNRFGGITSFGADGRDKWRGLKEAS